MPAAAAAATPASPSSCPSAPALSLIETGKRDARLTTLAKIAAALRVPIRTLLEDPADAASTGGDVPAEGYDLGDYL